MNVYFISGLGADKRIFKNLVLPEWCRIIHLEWLMPHPKEPLKAYCHRMAARIDSSKPFALVGLSFGGMVAVEISGFLPPKTIVLISSAATRSNLPPYYRWAGKLGLYHLISMALVRRLGFFANWFFGVKEPAEKLLLQQYLRHTPALLLKWSITSILKWNNKNRPANIFHLHGTADRVLPIKFANPDKPIENGSHFMVWERAAEISGHIARHLEPFNNTVN